MAAANKCFANAVPVNKPESKCTLGMHVQTISYASATLYNLKHAPSHLSTCDCCPEFKCEIAWYAAQKSIAGCTKAGIFVTTTTTTVYDVTGACLKSRMPTDLGCFSENPNFAFDREKLCRQRECWAAGQKVFEEVQETQWFMNGVDVKTELIKIRCPQCFFSQTIDKCPRKEEYLALPTKKCSDRQNSMKCPRGTGTLENLDKINGTASETCCKWTATCDTYDCATKHSAFPCNKANSETIKRPDEALGAKQSDIKNYCCNTGNCKADNSPDSNTDEGTSTAGPATSTTTPAPTNSAIVFSVSGVWVIAMEYASTLISSTEGLATFEKALEKLITVILFSGIITADRIQVDVAQSSDGSRRLSSNNTGNLTVSYTIFVQGGVDATAVATKINSKSTHDLKTTVNAALVDTVKTVPALQGVIASGVTIDKQGSVTSVSTSTSVPIIEGVSATSATEHGAFVASVSLLCAMTSLVANK